MATSERNEDHSPIILNGSFAALLTASGFSLTNLADWGEYFGDNPNSTGKNVMLNPLHSVMSGYVSIASGIMDRLQGNHWIWGNSTNSGVGYAYAFASNLTKVYATYISQRHGGYSLHGLEVEFWLSVSQTSDFGEFAKWPPLED